MWLRADLARALLLVGLLLAAIATGGEEATRYVVDATAPVERVADDGAGVVLPLDVDKACIR